MFFEIAKAASRRSSDPHTQVGACLVKDLHVIGVGYNGSPKGFMKDFNWKSDEKYRYVIHAEMNAVANANAIGVCCAGADIYLTHSPCARCILLLIQNRIKRVYFLEKYRDYDEMAEIAKNADIEVIQWKRKQR